MSSASDELTAFEADYEVIVIGAGFSGIGAGIKLKEAGIDDFVLLEQAGDIGGTWRDNTYPGVAVDLTSFTYQYSFEPNPDWSRAFAPGPELKKYADHCVDKYGIRDRIRLNTRVTELRFDEVRHCWWVLLPSGEQLSARFVIPVPGGLTIPKRPEIEGLEEFEGTTMHTARWDHEHDLSGERVAIIGTGATAVQVVPAIAPSVGHLDVYQRTPIWLLPKADAPLHWPIRAMFRYVPLTQYSMRWTAAALNEMLMVLGVNYNREFPQLVKAIESICRAHLRRQVSDPELRDKLTPRYGFGCKRPSFSNHYLRTFMRENVELVTEPIERITPNGIRSADGRERAIDTLILATGFKVFEPGNAPPFPTIGRRDAELGKFWDEHRYQAYQGVSTPLFPNLFSVLGPYGFTGASYFALIETQLKHILRVIKEARRRGSTMVEVRQDAHDRFFAEVMRRRGSQVFYNNSCGGSNSYYFDRHGDTPILRPSSGIEAWWRAGHFDLDDYAYEARRELAPHASSKRGARTAA
jgi:cation diffusion facilitator CzcD-associated flavoprotein CzcO